MINLGEITVQVKKTFISPEEWKERGVNQEEITVFKAATLEHQLVLGGKIATHTASNIHPCC